MSNHYDVIVVGVGAMGSASCHELARRGVRVLGLEQFDIANDRGSSHGRTRLIRLAYYEHPNYVPLLRRAYDKWRELELVSGQKLLHITGGLYLGGGAGELVPQSARAAKEHGIEHESLTRSQIADRFPLFHLPDDYIGLYEPSAGFLRPELAIKTFAEQAQLAGADIRTDSPVRNWSASSQHISVTTDSQSLTADRIVFTAGAWTAKLVRDLGIPLIVTRQTLGWIQPSDPTRFRSDRFPCYAAEQSDGSLYYGTPLNEFEPGMKFAHHKPGDPTDPDQISREATPSDEDSIQRFAVKVLPSAAGPIVDCRVCMYTNSPDSHFIIGAHPHDSRIVLACGFSGHGFKFASVVGEVIANLVQLGSTERPIEFLSPTRFQRS